MITINDLTTAILNQRGHFRALDGIYAITTADGSPSMRVMRDRTIFDVVYDGVPRQLVCPLREGEFFRDTPTAGWAYLPSTTVFPCEMTVYTRTGKTKTIDVAIQTIPDGAALPELMHNHRWQLPQHEIRSIFDGLCGLCIWAATELHSSRSIRAEDIFVTKDSRGKRVILTGHSQDIGGRPPAASGELTAALLLFFLFAADARYMDEFCGTHRFSYRSIREYLSLFHDMGCPAWQPFFSLLPMALSQVNATADSRFFTENVARIRRAAVDGTATTMPPRQPQTPQAAMRSYEGYTHVGPLRDGVSCAMRDGRWHYLDDEGMPVFDGSFLSASDFEGGRAVVGTERGIGLIDTAGGWIIEPPNDEICLDADDGLARVCRNGLFALFTDRGEQLTGFEFDSLERQACGLLMAQKDGLYGYIATDGTAAIDFVYDEAFSFNSGTAMVDFGGERFGIDTRGRRI